MWSGQGCQTLFVRAWDNTGESAVSSLGPLCYDNWPPTTTPHLAGNLQGQYYAGAVLVRLDPEDGVYGSGVASTVYQISGGTWRSYRAPFYVAISGSYGTVAFYILA